MTSVSEQTIPTYAPAASLVPGTTALGCQACVAIPARNEENGLAACLDAFARQVDLSGVPLPKGCFEVLLLLNNCSDGSAAIARAWQHAHPAVTLHWVELDLPAERANAGTARRLLLDTAWQRLNGSGSVSGALLCTDADSTVAPDWIVQNLRSLQRGADAVGGQITLAEGEIESLPACVRRCYRQDRCYGELVSQIEDLLDPQPGDPWPRHQDHFGSSLAFTREAYAKAGGMPESPVLEDEAFVHQLRRAGLCLRHEPAVRIFTSGRLNGRAKLGLAAQLRSWSTLRTEEAHLVQSAAFLVHRFQTLHRLREAFRCRSVAGVGFPTGEWRRWATQAVRAEGSVPDFLAAIDSDGLVDATFNGLRQQPVREAIADLAEHIAVHQAP